MSAKTLEEFNEEISELKNSLYDHMIRNNQQINPASLDSLHRYEELMQKIFTYWKTLYESGPKNYTLRMPSKELNKTFNEKTKWFIQNIINNSDFSFRTNAMKQLQKNCESEAVNLDK
jgi:DNA integrity scanning protein DisA with diadenylate cyclase activity